MQIRDNAFIVTGGASGLGGATSRMLAAQGGKVVIADVQADRGEPLARELGAAARFVQGGGSGEGSGARANSAQRPASSSAMSRAKPMAGLRSTPRWPLGRCVDSSTAPA